MENTASNTRQRSAFLLADAAPLALAGALILALLLLLPAGSSAQTSSQAGETSDLVHVLVTPRATAPAPFPLEIRTVLAGHVAGRAAAKSAARRSPARASTLERNYAAKVERARNRALPLIEQNAKAQVRAEDALEQQIAALGGRIERGPITAVDGLFVAIAKSKLEALGGLAGVAKISHVPDPIAMNTWAGGSQTWIDNGYFGQVPNADNANAAAGAGPDVVVQDEGITTGHIAFRKCAPSPGSACPAGSPTRVTSPSSRTNFNGSEHGNTIAATIASSNLSSVGSTGMAYGIDQLQDTNGGTMYPLDWLMGITRNGIPGVNDLAEVGNYSRGYYADTQPYDASGTGITYDALVEQYGMQWVIAAGNCGVADPFYTGCSDGPHRVGPPATNFNSLSVGGLTVGSPDTNTWAVWPNSSPGPTWDGRKKPDLIASPGGAAGGPLPYDNNSNGTLDDYGNTGMGTSYAAPMVAAGAALLSSVGVAAPVAQRAILINSAQPIQGQTYWTPTSGWGALDMTRAFNERANYAVGNVTGAGANSARFFRITGTSAGDRTTLVWNRRVSTFNPSPSPTYRALTNLDLFQFDPGTLASTASGGVDAADSVDANPVDSNTDPGTNAPTDNPMPGSGSDASDNVEQVRSTATGTQILKVKAQSAIDQRTSEPFALASARPITALATPIPEVTAALSKSTLGVGEVATLTLTATNPSNDLALSGVTLELGSLPSGIALDSSGSAPASTLPAGGAISRIYTLHGTGSMTGQLTGSASGSVYGENFGGSGSVAITIDGDAPQLTVNQFPVWSTTTTPEGSWSAEDGVSGVAGYDVEANINGGPWSRLHSDTSASQTALSGGEGETIGLRVRAKDAAGNVSAWQSTQTGIDAEGPAISFGSSSAPTAGEVRVPVTVSNVGAPIASKSYRFSRFGSGSFLPLIGTATFVNGLRESVSATLEIEAEDALGRKVSARRSFSVGTGWISSGLRLTRLRGGRGSLTVEGRVASGYHGRIKIVAKRRGKRGSKRVAKNVYAKNGRFKVRLRAPTGNYRVTVIALESARRFLARSAARNISTR